MSIVLFILSAFVLFFAVVIFASASSVLHEMLAGIAIVISAIMFTGAAIVDAINKIQNEIRNNPRRLK